MLRFRSIILAGPCAFLAFLSACGTTPAVDPLLRLQPVGLADLHAVSSRLFTSGQVTQDQLGDLAERGITHLVCVRAAEEPQTGWEDDAAAQFGVEFLRLPIQGSDGLTRTNARKLHSVLRRNNNYDGRTLVYGETADRAAALIALEAFFDRKMAAEFALAVGKRVGLDASTRAVEKRLGLAAM